MLMSNDTGTVDVLHCSLEVGFSSDGAADAVLRSMLPSTLEAAAILCLCVLNDHLLGFQRLMPGSGPDLCLGAFDAGQAHLHSIKSVQFPYSEITVLHVACIASQGWADTVYLALLLERCAHLALHSICFKMLEVSLL